MYDVEVLDYTVHGTTGMIDVTVCAVSDENGVTMRGPIRKYGIDAALLQSQYNGDVQQWLQFVKQEQQRHHGFHADVVGALAVMKGKRIN